MCQQGLRQPSELVLYFSSDDMIPRFADFVSRMNRLVHPCSCAALPAILILSVQEEAFLREVTGIPRSHHISVIGWHKPLLPDLDADIYLKFGGSTRRATKVLTRKMRSMPHALRWQMNGWGRCGTPTAIDAWRMVQKRLQQTSS